MHDHLEERDGGDADGFEVVGVVCPWFGCHDGLFGGGVVVVESVAVGVDEFDDVFSLCGRVC